MPAQKAFPAPVTTTTRACPRSISSRAVCSSAIMVAEMALRLSGRFSVMVATCRLASRISVVYMSRISSQFTSGACAYFAQSHKDDLRGDVSYQIVSRKGTAAKPGERAVKAAASGFECSEDFFFSVLGAAMEMDTQLDPSDVIPYLAIELADKFGCGRSDSVGERNCANAEVFEPFERIGDNFGAPRLVVGIAETHRNVDHESALGRNSFFLQFFD